MLQTFRAHSGGIFAKVIFGAIIASFALWGVGDMFRNYTSMRPVATVGETAISQDEFRRSYEKMISYFQTVTKGKITPEELRSMGVSKRVMDELIDEALLSNEVKRLGLHVSDDMVATTIRSIPAFQDEQGNFSAERFRAVIRENGMNEAIFSQQVRNNLKKQQLFTSLTEGLSLPQSYQEQLFKAMHEERVFSVVYVPLTAMEITDKPSDADLELIYKQNQELFTRPEYRDVTLLLVDPQKVQKNLSVTPEQLQEEYERRKPDFTIPERRDVSQILFGSRDMADKAHARLISGDSLANVVKEFGGKIQQQYQGANQDKFSPAHSEVIFKMPEPGFTEVTDSMLGWTIFVVHNIIPSTQQPFDNVKKQLEEDLRTRMSTEGMDDLRNKLEDELAGGSAISEVAKNHQLDLINVGNIDQKANKIGNGENMAESLRAIVSENAFSLPSGSDSPVLDVADGKMLIVHVNSVTPKTTPPLTDIRDEVVKYWRLNKQQEKAAEFVQKMAKEAKTVESLGEQAKKNKLVMRTLPAISLSGVEEKKFKDEVIGAQALRRGFKLPHNQAGYAPAKDGFVVIMTNKIIPFDDSKKKDLWAKFQESLKGMLQRDFQTEYMKTLKSQQTVDVNHQILDGMLNRGQ